MTEPYIFLDPNGTQDFGLVVLVAAETGVIYAHQCGGFVTEIRELEGFAVPLATAAAAQPLRTFFWERFHGNPPLMAGATESLPAAGWSQAALSDLSALVSQVPFWATYPPSSDRADQRELLQLDDTRLSELTEAWIPVRTAYGPGVLVFPNSD